jgi:hypothetical protein
MSSLLVTADAIRAAIMATAFKGPILQNNIRGLWVEHMLALALAPDWQLCSGDWAGWDMVHRERGMRVQIRQSAARQSWKAKRPYPGAFSVAPVTGYWRDGVDWVAAPGRHAELFVFAWHPVEDDSADHTDPSSWRFYVLSEHGLPAQKTISRRAVARMAPELQLGELARALEAAVR